MLHVIMEEQGLLELVFEVRSLPKFIGICLIYLHEAGIPTIIKPFFGDQFFWADRVEALGVGSGVRKLTVDSLADALRIATTDHKQIARAKSLGEQIRLVCFFNLNYILIIL